MIQITDGKVDGNVRHGSYAEFQPWHHDSGTAIWLVDNVTPTHVCDGHNIRKATQAEIEADPLYIAWIAEQNAENAQAAAKTLFTEAPDWLKTFSAADAETYIETNVTDLTSSKVALKELSKAIIIFRDYLKITTEEFS